MQVVWERGGSSVALQMELSRLRMLAGLMPWLLSLHARRTQVHRLHLRCGPQLISASCARGTKPAKVGNSVLTGGAATEKMLWSRTTLLYERQLCNSNSRFQPAYWSQRSGELYLMMSEQRKQRLPAHAACTTVIFVPLLDPFTCSRSAWSACRIYLDNLLRRSCHPRPRAREILHNHLTMSEARASSDKALRRLFRCHGASKNVTDDCRLLETGSYSDLTIKCGHYTFRVHKNLICSRSQYFTTACKPDAFKV